MSNGTFIEPADQAPATAERLHVAGLHSPSDAVLSVRDLNVSFNSENGAVHAVRGVNFDLMAQPPGVIARSEPELADAFRSGAAWSDQAAKDRAEFRARFCPWDDGQAAERAVRRVFLGETLPKLPR